MQTCKDVCPVYHIHRCCFHCDKRNECGDVCAEESNDLCELLVEMEDSPEKVAEPILKELVQIQKQKANLEEKEKDLKERLKGMMEDAGITGFKKNPYMKVTQRENSGTYQFSFYQSDPTGAIPKGLDLHNDHHQHHHQPHPFHHHHHYKM